MAITLANRALQLTSPFGKDVLLPERVDISERMSQPFQWVLDVVSENGELDGEQILGNDVTFSFKLPSGGATRYFNGFVTEFSQTGYVRRLHHYRAIVRPWLWFLTRSADCRIFQHKTIPTIFEDVVKQYGFTDYKLKLSGKYDPWDYCVQYRETDFNFVSRLLEQAGIHYHFEHSDGHHVMVLCDDSTTLGKVAGYDQIPFVPPDSRGVQDLRDHFDDWSVTRSVLPGAYVTTDYDFEKPRNSLAGRASISRQHARANFEIFDFPAELAKLDSKTSDSVAKVRIEELQAPYLVARGRGDAAGIAPGYRFALTRHPRKDLNIEYLVTGATYLFHAEAYDAGTDGGLEFSVAIEAIDAKTPYRPARITPKPVVHGAQTAMVVGQSGAEIDTDKYARVRVQFPWDREGKKDENSSCWVRVAQLWAGKQWGAIHIPRIGQEVLVSFLEGDPDRPIITGRVYNGDSMPPYALPANATLSGIKSRSSKDGAAENFNEIRFEDKKGEELLFIQAEKDLNKVVEHDQAIKVGHDETVEIKNDRTSTIKNNETCTIDKDRKTTIHGTETRTVDQDRTTEIKQDETLKVDQNQKTNVGQKFTLDAGTEIALTTGQSSLTMKADGTITLKGIQLTIEGLMSVTAKVQSQKVALDVAQVSVAGTMIDIKGQAMTGVSGAMLDLKGTGMATLKGGITMIG